MNSLLSNNSKTLLKFKTYDVIFVKIRLNDDLRFHFL